MGMPMGAPMTRKQFLFSGYDYMDYFGDYVSDYAYDYYDWICSEVGCQLCDILTSECCDPEADVNCFLPDSCLNNPCLSGGTCITTTTFVGPYRDFVCVCLPGLTGKYCQLTNDYFLPSEVVMPLVPNVPTMPPVTLSPPVPPPKPNRSNSRTLSAVKDTESGLLESLDGKLLEQESEIQRLQYQLSQILTDYHKTAGHGDLHDQGEIKTEAPLVKTHSSEHKNIPSIQDFYGPQAQQYK